jgi:hypothetical protein
MKKKLVIFRFGSESPLRKEVAIIQAITGGTGRGIGIGSNFGVISIVETEFTPKEVESLYTQVANEENDELPVIVWDPNGDTGFNLPVGFFPQFSRAMKEFDDVYGNQCTLSLDELLDLVKAKGVNNLTEEEMKRLKELTK